MTRVAIIGNARGGKSLLGQFIQRTLQLPLHSIDNAQWAPGWIRRDPSDVAARHAEWLKSERWVIDGWGEWELIDSRFTAADTIVLIDFPFPVHVRWALRRQAEVRRGLRNDWPPEGCRAEGMTNALLQTMEYVHRELRPRLLALVAESRFAEKVVHLRSPAELQQWRTRIGARSSGDESPCVAPT